MQNTNCSKVHELTYRVNPTFHKYIRCLLINV